MTYAPIAADIINRVTRDQVNGAHPDDPVVPYVEPPVRPGARARIAAGLRRLADALEPGGRRVTTVTWGQAS